MRRRILWGLLLVVWAASWTAPSTAGIPRPPGKSYALLFATNEYMHWEYLANPVPDMRALAEDLKNIYGFEVDAVENPTLVQIQRKLQEYRNRQYGPMDRLLVFFAGHGAFEEGAEEGYLVARDSESEQDDPFYNTYLGYKDILPLLDNFKVPHLLLMVDACFSGTLDKRIATRQRGGGPPGGQIGQYVSDKMRHRTRLFVASGGKETVDDGLAGRHSPFARGLLEGLRAYGGDDGVLHLQELMSNYITHSAPTSLSGGFESNEPGTNFFFFADAELVKQRVPTETVDAGASRAPSGLAATTMVPKGGVSVELRAEAGAWSSGDVERRVRKLELRDSSWNPEGDVLNAFQASSLDYDDVVVDWATGLMWQQAGSSRRLTREEAEAWIADLNERGYAGYTDWRLPTVEEMASLIEPEAGDHGLYIDPTFDPEQVECWTADTNAESGDAWHVRFQKGHIRSFSRDPMFFVRLVRRD